ncbi:MAG: integrase/recombinase XerD [Oleiphilaceae bacterium]|jgi:integrase/recombinase XerD
MTQQRFGASSEKWSPDKLGLFDEAEILSDEDEIDGRILQSFAIYADERGMLVPLELTKVKEWANLAPSGSEIAIARRMAILRALSLYLHILEPTSPVIETSQIGRTQRRLSNHTISAYRDSLKLYLSFLSDKLKRPIAMLSLNDIDRESAIEFLQYLEVVRNNSVRTRNNRLAAIRCFLNYVAGDSPSAMLQVSEILSIPQKRWDKPLVGYLEREEIEALINSTDSCTWSGERDHTMLLLFYNTGARVSEVTRLQRQDVDLNRQHTIHFYGKGRKERVVPLWPKTVQKLKRWLEKIPQNDNTPLFSNHFGEPLSRSGVRQRLLVAQKRAIQRCPSLDKLKISQHTLRHTTAMSLLQSGVDLSLIALWLGHEQLDTTHQYMEANLEMKKIALKSLKPIETGDINRFLQPSDAVLAFL